MCICMKTASFWMMPSTFPGPFMVEPNGTGVSSKGVGEAISESLSVIRLASL